jgi:hypothetical protein
MGHILIDGETFPANDAPEWMATEASSCLELAASFSGIRWNGPSPFSLPFQKGSFGLRSQLTDQEAKLMCHHLHRDASILNNHVARMFERLGVYQRVGISAETPYFSGGIASDTWNNSLNATESALRRGVKTVIAALRDCAILSRELPWGWDTSWKQWPDSPIRTPSDLLRFFDNEDFRTFPSDPPDGFDEQNRNQPSWYWRQRRTIHAALDDFGVLCPLERTSCPDSLLDEYTQFVEILNWLKAYVANAKRRAEQAAPESTDWTDWVLTKNAKLWFADDITSKTGWTGFANKHECEGLLRRRKVGREVQIHRSLFAKYQRMFPSTFD